MSSATDIRIAVSFKGHRKRRKLRMLLGAGSTDYLIDLWINTATNHPGGVLTGMSILDVALEAGWEDDPEKFVSAMIEAGFLDKGEDGNYRLHDWEDHQPELFIVFRPAKSQWDAIRKAVFDRDNNTCTYCGKSDVNLECDHVVPLSRGGNNDMKNLTTSCVSCNRSKGAKTLEEWRQ